MKPSTLIKQKCKTQKQQLEVSLALIDYFVGTSEVEWAIEVTKKTTS